VSNHNHNSAALSRAATRPVQIAAVILALLLGATLWVANATPAEAVTWVGSLKQANQWPSSLSKTCSSSNGSGSCVSFSKYNSSSVPNTILTQKKSSCRQQNCVHYTAYRVQKEYLARNAKYTKSNIFIQKCASAGSNPKSWDERARKCGLKVDTSNPKAGDILQWDGVGVGFKRDGGSSVSKYGSGGHVAFVDKVEKLSNGDFRLYVSQTGCHVYSARYTVKLSTIKAANAKSGYSNKPIELIHPNYPSK
jgi:hypothetical protein